MQKKCNTKDTSVTHKCNTSARPMAQVRHECYTNYTSATRVKNFDFDYNTSKNIFSHPYIYYMASMYVCISLFRIDQINSTTMTNKNRVTPHTGR